MAGFLDSLLTGSILSGNQDKNAQDALSQVTGAYNGISAPKLTPEQLQQYAWLASMNPSLVNTGADVQASPVTAAQAQTALAGPSALSSIQDNPALLSQEQGSLGALQDLASRGGMNQTDVANLNRIQDSAAQQSRGQQDAIMQSMAERGMGGSGNELLARLSASQNATNQAAQQGLDIAGQAQQRALQAMMQGGQLASQLQGQQFNESAQKAAAADAIARFNAQNANQTNQYNTSAQNQANEYNSSQRAQLGLANRQLNVAAQQYNANAQNQAGYYNNQGQQNTANMNTGIENQQQIYNTQQLPQTEFNDQMGLAAAKSGAAQAGVNYWNNQSQQSRQGFQNFMQGAIGAGTTMGGNYANTGSAFTNASDASNMSDATGQKWNTNTGSLGGYANGGLVGAAEHLAPLAMMLMAHGGPVPGVPKVPFNSPANDTVQARLSPGEEVLPLSVTKSTNPIKSATSFLKAQGFRDKGPGQPKMKLDDISTLLKNLSPKHQLNSALYREQEQEDAAPDTDSKLAALSAMAK